MHTNTRHLIVSQILLTVLIFISNRPSSPSRLSAQSFPAEQVSTESRPLDGGEQMKEGEPLEEPAPECEVFADYGKNYLTPIDVVVKNSDNNVACIKARFALSIKVEELFTVAPRSATNSSRGLIDGENNQSHTIRSVLGYLPLEHVLSVEDSCPEPKGKVKNEKRSEDKLANGGSGQNEGTKADQQLGAKNRDTSTTEVIGQTDDDDELEMIVTFGCGKLSFTFKRDQRRIYVSSIKGIVKLDKKVVREFIATRPMFATSDLEHHFKYDDIIEVTSEAQAKTYILTANFYFTEIEAFRGTTSRDFVQPADDHSKPFDESRENDPATIQLSALGSPKIHIPISATNRQPAKT